MPSLADLLNMGKNYVKDAMPGGLLNPEVTSQGVLDGAAMATTPLPVIGDLLGLGADLNRYKNEPESRTLGNFALSGLGMLPFVPAMGGILKRADLKPGGEHFGNWELQNVEKRTKLEEYLDAQNEVKTKRVADMDNAETSWGSGKPIANIYWMKDKKTGELRPFGDDTAHYAMGKDSSAEAKKIFNAEWAKEQDKWLSSEAAKYGIQTQNMGLGSLQANLYTHPVTGQRTPTSIVNLREWLIRDQLSREEVAKRLAGYFGK